MQAVTKHNLEILCESFTELSKGCVISLLQNSGINGDKRSDPWIHNPCVQPLEWNLSAWQSGIDTFLSVGRRLTGQQGCVTALQLKNW